MRLRTIPRHFKEAFMSLRRNGLMSLASVGTVAIALLILGSAVLLITNANFALGSAENELQITVVVDKEATEDTVQDLEVAINELPNVRENKYISKADALAELRDGFQERGDVLEFGEQNPLPDTFRVKVDNSTHVTNVANKIKKLDGVDSVKFPQDVVNKLLTLIKWVRIAGAAVVLLLGLASIFLISTTIRLTVFARRKEIGIMKFLGATDWYIRWPFILEGIILGLGGAIISVSILYISYMSLADAVRTALPFMPLQADPQSMLLLMEVLVAAGVVIGAVGSTLSVRKFLKV